MKRNFLPRFKNHFAGAVGLIPGPFSSGALVNAKRNGSTRRDIRNNFFMGTSLSKRKCMFTFTVRFREETVNYEKIMQKNGAKGRS